MKNVSKKVPINETCSNNRINFHKVKKALMRCIKYGNKKGIKQKLLNKGTDWQFNTPTALNTNESTK